uniref:RanBP2-type domain-containing protein n=1 Tax=Anopheles coluzzii TaxID=1518534 RepID=A0A6E8VLF2_ANOCL|nr:protein tamozhennic [Anopheles coluzzii]XP_040220731.2 protein tamozhennic [Anopheles coluzzii]XP_049461328.1 protein tamozhennic [Anopheles coluzzii]
MAYGASETHDALWKQILEHHWKYVESEESMLKIELRRDLEDLIEKRLGKVPPNEKFYLDDTRYAFDSSVAHLDDFSAYKASIGFEAISQYANNLFVKPWRKEYKVIKMYSGFYQHEIAANLVNAEKLFQAMGYQLMPNKTLILDGPICPDQVMNVARDAITAYVECQMMKRIYSELTPLRLSIDWIDIYNFRSYHAADVMQTVKQMALSIQEKHHKKQQAKLRDTYGNNSASALAPASSCNSCNPYQFHVQSQQPPPVPPPAAAAAAAAAAAYCGANGGGNGGVVGSSQLYNSAVAGAPCSIHSQQHHQQQQQPPPVPPPPPPSQQQMPANAYGGAYHPHHLPSSHHHHHHHHHQQQQHSSYQNFQPTTTTSASQQQQQQQVCAPALGTMPHSKSLDHYQDANSAAAAAAAAASAANMYGMSAYMQRHSIDQPYHYTLATPYGGSQGAGSSAAGMQPAYEGGPLDGLLSCGVAGGVANGPSAGAVTSCNSNNHPYNNVPGSGRYPPLQYAGTTNFPMGIPGPGPMFMNGGGQLKHHQNGLVDGCGSYRHPAMNLAYPGYRGPNGMMAAPPSYCQPVDSSIYGGAPMSSVAATQTAAYGTPLVPAQPAASILSGKKKGYDDYDMMSSMRRGTDTLRSGSGCAKKLDRYHKNAELLIDYESDMLPEALAERNQKEQQQQQQQPHHHHHHYLHHQTSRNSRQSDFDSYEDEQLQREQEQSSNVSRRISSKNQDGIGCYETWNYVYQNLEKQGYSKDLGERGDFLADELDADDNHLIGTAAEEDDLRRRRRNDLMTDDHHDHHHHHHSGRRESGNASSSATLRRNHNEKLKAMKPKAADKVDGIVRQASAGLSSTKQPMAEGRRHERHPSTGSGVTATTMLVQKAAKMSLSNNATNDDLLLGSFEQNGASKGEPPAAGSSRRNSVTKKQITPQGSGSSSSTGLPAKETNKTHSSTSTGILVNNHHQHSHSATGSGSAYPSHGGAPAQGKKKTATFDTGAVTIINPSPTGSGSPSGSGAPAGAEWNCNFCTYLNPDVKRICDMCSKSRDFRLDGTTTASNGTTATCV